MEAWAIFRHALRMVFDNFGDALRVTGVPFLVPLAIILGAIFMINDAQTEFQPYPFSAMAIILLVVGGLGLSVGSLWSIVGWHRYVLLEERPNIVPKFLGRRILAYVGKGILVGLLMIALSFVLSLVVGGVFMASLANSTNSLRTSDSFFLEMFVLSKLSTFVISVPLFTLMYRLAPLLPAAALGVPMKISEAWSKTDGHTVTLLGVAFLSVLAINILQIPQIAHVLSITRAMDNGMLMTNMGAENSVGAGHPIWLYAYEFLLAWLQMFVGASILTTIYGRYVEGRELRH